MAKRFSLREMGLLMLPVVLVGAAGWWVSNRLTDEGKPRLTLRIQRPTTLQAFEGGTGTFIVGLKQRGDEFRIQSASPYFEVQTATGQRISDRKWRDPRRNTINGDTFSMNTRKIPPGALSFDCNATIGDSYAVASAKVVPQTPLLLAPLSGKWKVNRAQIEAPNLAAMPCKPLVSLCEFRVTRRTPSTVTGEAVFQLEGETMGAKTLIETSFTNRESGMGWGNGQREIPRARVVEWSVAKVPKANTQKISGRVSADNRWPLGFQIEPFNFQTVKIGQKLKFKTFPVPLPNSSGD